MIYIQVQSKHRSNLGMRLFLIRYSKFMEDANLAETLRVVKIFIDRKACYLKNLKREG
jgi:hypothetical protein